MLNSYIFMPVSKVIVPVSKVILPVSKVFGVILPALMPESVKKAKLYILDGCFEREKKKKKKKKTICLPTCRGHIQDLCQCLRRGGN